MGSNCHLLCGVSARFTSLEGNRDHKILQQKQRCPYFVERTALTPSEQFSRMTFRVSEARTSRDLYLPNRR